MKTLYLIVGIIGMVSLIAESIIFYLNGFTVSNILLFVLTIAGTSIMLVNYYLEVIKVKR